MNKRLIVFTDLDGTLLDHDSYSFEPASSALAELKQRAIPLVLVSSKTRAEILELQQQLDISAPFICENGAAVFWQGNSPEKSLSGKPSSDKTWRCQAFSSEYVQILQCLQQLREEGFSFHGFNDCSAEEVAELTGLSVAAATLAAQRDYTEPLLWQGSEESLITFKQRLAECGLQAMQGGRFLSVMGQFDKGSSLRWLRQQYEKSGPVTTVALGDSPNDEPMLSAADIAVVIQSARSKDLVVETPGQCIRTTLPGPRGWQQAMSQILHAIT